MAEDFIRERITLQAAQSTWSAIAARMPWRTKAMRMDAEEGELAFASRTELEHGGEGDARSPFRGGVAGLRRDVTAFSIAAQSEFEAGTKELNLHERLRAARELAETITTPVRRLTESERDRASETDGENKALDLAADALDAIRSQISGGLERQDRRLMQEGLAEMAWHEANITKATTTGQSAETAQGPSGADTWRAIETMAPDPSAQRPPRSRRRRAGPTEREREEREQLRLAMQASDRYG